METKEEKMNGKIIMTASRELIATLYEMLNETNDRKQYAAAYVMLSAALALRDTVNRPQAPQVFDSRIDSIKAALEALENEE